MKEPICKNCQLYNWQERHCQVFVLYEGEKMHPPTEPEDKCIFTTEIKCYDENGKLDVWTPTIEEVKLWAENPVTGEKSNKGVVKIQYPVGFFGDETKD